jgi:hypothetical protein
MDKFNKAPEDAGQDSAGQQNSAESKDQNEAENG